MAIKFTYYNPVKIRFCVDYLEAIKNVAGKLKSTRFLLVTSKGFSKRGLSDKIENALGVQLVGIVDEILPNPQLKHLQGIKSTLADFDAIIAVGGGSVIDSAKFFAYNLSRGNLSLDKHSADLLNFGRSQTSSLVSRPKFSKSNESHTENPSVVLKNKESTETTIKNNRRDCGGDFVFVKNFGVKTGLESANTPKFFTSAKGVPKSELQPKIVPLYAIPTTSGTSSELTHWATIWDNDAFIKHSLSDESLYPKEAIYDPRLTLSLPRDTTIHTALDALSHSFESIWNKSANPISTHYALNAIEIILRDLVDLSHNLDSLSLRTNIMQASIYAGLAFSNTQTALAHALSYPLTMRFGTPHGLACSFSLPLLLDTLPKTSEANALLSPFRERLLWLFDTLEISTNPKDYGLDLAFIDEIFTTLNPRAKNGIFDIARVKKAFIKLF